MTFTTEVNVIPEFMPGDANGDGLVNASDASILSSNWLTTLGATWTQADFNGDGAVNDIDATLLAANWSSSANASVPEPSTLAGLLGLCLAGLLTSFHRESKLVGRFITSRTSR